MRPLALAFQDSNGHAFVVALAGQPLATGAITQRDANAVRVGNAHALATTATGTGRGRGNDAR